MKRKINLSEARKSGWIGGAGYTLVELITVLVILAVLAAIMIPSLIGFIDKVKERLYVTEAYEVCHTVQIYTIEKLSDGDAGMNRIYRDIMGKDLSKKSNPLRDYLTVSCTKGAMITGLTLGNKPDLVISEMIYQVKGYKITVGEDHPAPIVEKMK